MFGCSICRQLWRSVSSSLTLMYKFGRVVSAKYLRLGKLYLSSSVFMSFFNPGFSTTLTGAMSFTTWKITADVISLCFWLFLSYAVALEKEDASNSCVSDGWFGTIFSASFCQLVLQHSLHRTVVSSVSSLVKPNHCQTMEPELFLLGTSSSASIFC